MKLNSLARTLCIAGTACYCVAASAAGGKDVPHIQFETNFRDLGKVMVGDDSISGSFRFKNTGKADLKVGPVSASCDCTTPAVHPETVAPGGSGEVTYTIRLDRQTKAQRVIHVPSNDPDAPMTELTVQLDYTPLYELNPPILIVKIPAGQDEAHTSFTITRNDGKPVGVERMTSSRPWVSASFDDLTKTSAAVSRINVAVHRPSGPPGPFNANVQLWATNETSRPLKTMTLSGLALSEVEAAPARVYWLIPDLGANAKAYPPGTLAKKVDLKSVLGREFEIKNVTSTINGMDVEVTPREAAKSFELQMKFDALPKGARSGKIIVETSLASLPRLEIPVTVAAPTGQ